MDEIAKDERFKHIIKDSRFRIMPKNERKFKIDRRFKNMFEDKKFKLKYTVDKRGRPVNMTTNDNLKKFYQLSSESENEDDHEKKEKETLVDTNESEDQSESEPESESETESAESSDTEQEAEPIPWNELDADTKRGDDVTRRLALCNMDWDRIKAVDLYVLLNSFKPTQGVIKSVKIYISDYGKQRMEYEKMHGPAELTENGDLPEEEESDSDINDDEDEGRKFDRRKLRIYQFNRLKYFYAIVECDSVETADKIYTECDGLEYESSSTRLDLRFVPDDTEFEEVDLKDSCCDAPDPITYKPNLFVTTALNQTKVECTWDETPKDRLAITMRKYTEEDLKNSDFKNILATSSEEESDDEDNEKNEEEIEGKKELTHGDKDDEEEKIRKYRELLLGIDKKSKKDRDCDLEFSWDGGIEDDGFDDSFTTKKTNKKNKRYDKSSKVELTEEEKKEQARLSLLTMDNEDQKSHFNLDDLLLDKKQKRNKKKSKYEDEEKREDNFEVDLKDPRFQAIFNDHRFNIDPSDQMFKKTKAMENILDEKVKRIKEGKLVEDKDEDSQMDKNSANGISLLVKSIKSKTENLKRKKNDSKFKKNKKFNS